MNASFKSHNLERLCWLANMSRCAFLFVYLIFITYRRSYSSPPGTSFDTTRVRSSNSISISRPLLPQPTVFSCSLLPPVLLHHEDLDHPDEDVQEVQLKADALVDWILLDVASLCQTSVVQHLLHIVKSEATKDSETTVQPEVLGESESANSGGGKNEGCKAGKTNNYGTSEQGTTDVEVLLLLGGGADNGDGTHDTNGVEAGASKEGSGGKGEEGSHESSLGSVEGSPERVLGNVAIADVSRYSLWVHQLNQVQTYLSGAMDRVPIMVAKLSARPPIPTTHGFMTMSLYVNPVMTICLAVKAMMPTPKPV